MTGYQANVEEQTEGALRGIQIAFAGAPLAAAILVLILLQFYKLKKGWETRNRASDQACSLSSSNRFLNPLKSALNVKDHIKSNTSWFQSGPVHRPCRGGLLHRNLNL